MNRQEMINHIHCVNSRAFHIEISYYMSIEEREYKYDEVCALFDYESQLEEFLVGPCDVKYRMQYRGELKVVRRTLIDIGFYREMLQDEIDNTWRSDSRSPWHFILKEKKWTTDEHASEWMEIGENDETQ